MMSSRYFEMSTVTIIFAWQHGVYICFGSHFGMCIPVNGSKRSVYSFQSLYVPVGIQDLGYASRRTPQNPLPHLRDLRFRHSGRIPEAVNSLSRHAILFYPFHTPKPINLPLSFHVQILGFLSLFA